MTYNEINFNNKTILITGGAGFIGSNLAFYFQENYPKSHVVVFDCFRSEVTFANGNLQSFGHYKNLIDFKGDVVCGNINNKVDLSLLDDYKFDYIFHQAAISDTRVYDQELVMQTNVNSFYDLLDIAKKDNAVMVYASSAATYGSLPSPQVVGTESPENPYGYSKYAMDQIACRFMKENPEMSVVGLRYFNVYGTQSNNSGSPAKFGTSVITIFHQRKKREQIIEVTGDGEQKRDFVHVQDVVEANYLSANSDRSSGVYNVATGKAISIKKLASMMSESWVHVPEQIGEPRISHGDIGKIRRDLNWRPRITLRQALERNLL